MAEENFYKEFKEVYQAIDLIGKEILNLKRRIENMDNNIRTIINDVNEVKQKLDSQVRQRPASQKSMEDDPEKKAAYDKYVRSRTGDFKPGDKEIEIDNVFYTGSRKRV